MICRQINRLFSFKIINLSRIQILKTSKIFDKYVTIFGEAKFLNISLFKLKMNYDIIRLLDKYMGVPLCFLFSIIDSLFPKGKKREIKNILIIRFWGIGSIILSSPTLKTIRENYPQAKIYFLTMKRNEGVYDGSNLMDEIIYYNFKNYFNVFKDFFKVIFYIRKKKIDLAIDLEHFSKFSSIVTYLSGAWERAGFFTKGQHREGVYTIKVPFSDYHHVVENFLNIPLYIGLKSNSGNLVKLPVTDKEKIYINQLLEKNKVGKKDLIVGININSSDFAIERRWPKEKYVELADKILKKHPNAKIFFIGAKFDKEFVQSTIDMIRDHSK